MKSYSHAKQLPVAHRPSVFQSPDEDEEEDYEQWLEIKGKLWELLLPHHQCPCSSRWDLWWAGQVLPGAWVLWAELQPPGL